ncbi:ATP-binding protein [Rhizobium oryzicola]|uniref:histidine kinase n=1 Tax=Rhizobium oryzicola TaxID=1232668 RepID=A0ABT8SX03_9HYPH|nr:ATP-binding protein [Rhizobium oryzicola]MDO1582990.1 ATP-binding protein [Rhizobium oryzicola]
MTETDSDLEACAREPIRIPGAIQPHGALFVLSPADGIVLQISANAPQFFSSPVRPSHRLEGGLAKLSCDLLSWYPTDAPNYQCILPEQGLAILAHRAGGNIIVEAERVDAQSLEETFHRLRAFVGRLNAQADVRGSLQAAANFVQELTDFDRVLVYRFDENWDGRVVAEAGNGQLPNYLDLRFPSSDIPSQARDLYASNRLRIIPDIDYTAIPLQPVLNPRTGEPLDMSFAQLRSVSPVHLEYMRNMGTAASMSVSIIIDGRLWGLVACHSVDPHLVARPIRDACDFLAQSLGMRIAALERIDEAARHLQLSHITSRLLAGMSTGADWVGALAAMGDDLLAQVNATGAAIITENTLHRLGQCPQEMLLRRLLDWLEKANGGDMVATDSLAVKEPLLEPLVETASGILAIRLSELHPSWLIWFRPEVVHTVTWGGNPHKVVRESGRIHPRNSFAAWSELVRYKARPWTEAELTAAKDLRAAIVGIVLRQAEELAELTNELQRSNKELEAFSYSISHDLRAPFRHIVGFAQLLRERERNLDEKSHHYLETISEAAVAAGRLVDDLLNFSQLGRASIVSKSVDMNKLVAEVIQSVSGEFQSRAIDWKVEPLPIAWGDATLLRQVWFNLIENAVKYTGKRAIARIEIFGREEKNQSTYVIRDNGVGFDMAYVGKLFGVFQRLQRPEDFEGTGIGLALTRRIVEKHNGSIRAEGELDKGATFTFALPTIEKKGRAIA